MRQSGFTRGEGSSFQGWLDSLAIYRAGFDPEKITQRYRFVPPPSVVAVSLEGSESWSLLSAGTREVRYTDEEWQAYEAERRPVLARMNAAARAERRAANHDYWDRRRTIAAEWLANIDEVTVPELPNGYPAQNAIDHFLATRMADVKQESQGETGGVDYFKQIRPLLESRCYDCHQGDKAQGGLRIDDHRSTLIGGDSDGPAIVAGNIDKSALIDRITSEDKDVLMPPRGDPLTDEEVALLKRWIKDGAGWPQFDVDSFEPTPLADDLHFLRRVTPFTYSSVGQLTSRKYPNGSRATFSYDTTGNRTLLADSTGRYTSTYDALGQTMITASPNNQRATYTYDAVGTRRSMDATGAGRFTYVFDAASQLSSLRNPYSERTTFSYDDGGRRTVQRNANGTRDSLSYDAASQTTQVFHRTSAGATVLQLDYGYDPAGNRKSMAENATAARTTWTYDKQNQLLGEYRTGTNAYRQTFTYDNAGNRTLKNVDAVRTTYAYDPANQLEYGEAAAGRTTYVYDLTGNQQIEQPPTGNRTTTTWNYENQPTQYRLPAGSPVTMTYNGDNRRMSTVRGATNTTKFVWDATTDAYLSELDGTNAVVAVYTNEPQQYGGVLAMRRNSALRIYHADALGTTRLLTTSTQVANDTYLLDAWGNLIASTGTIANPFKWVGRYGYYTDTLTGLVYVRARMYGPVTGRWLSIDPAGFIDGANLFRAYFVPDSADPSGMKPEPRTLDCAATTCCEPGSCEFFFSMDVDNRKLCMVQKPFEPNPDPKVPPNPPASNICTSSIDRTIQPGDHMTLVLRGGTRCELTEANFYNEAGQQVPWPPRGMEGFCQVVVDPTLGARLDPGKPPGTGGCYVFGELIDAVEFKFTIEVSCGCASGRNYDTIEFEEKVQF